MDQREMIRLNLDLSPTPRAQVEHTLGNVVALDELEFIGVWHDFRADPLVSPDLTGDNYAYAFRGVVLRERATSFPRADLLPWVDATGSPLVGRINGFQSDIAVHTNARRHAHLFKEWYHPAVSASVRPVAHTTSPVFRSIGP